MSWRYEVDGYSSLAVTSCVIVLRHARQAVMLKGVVRAQDGEVILLEDEAIVKEGSERRASFAAMATEFGDTEALAAQVRSCDPRAINLSGLATYQRGLTCRTRRV